ncbi:histidine kinase dimerization/phosphoacceptor domain -containing protein [Hymenobacter negativus]|uniref:histidine kinase n=1 Tax=Hymenobacter negativus TaxID=2795026 RepID=A0ABS3QLT7_9BACT|nr:histidine kinase dimerization/phosphoacceptor domain -containing protein [Hymenobacter negativus]MBO2012240.1 histidine kinase [Hymenobacter negativus]
MPRALLILLLLLTSGVLAAEPLYPALSAAAAHRLRQELWQTPPSKKRVALLLALSQDLIAKYQRLGTPLDSALIYRQQAQTLSQQLRDVEGQIRSSYTLGNFWLGLGKTAEGKKLLLQGLTSSTQFHYARLEADGWYYLSETYTLSATDFPKRIASLERAMALYQTLNDGERAAYTLKTIADLHLQQGKDGLARAELLQVLARYHAIGYRRLHYTYDLLSVTSGNLGDYKEAFRYGQAAIESALASRDTTDLNLFYCRMGSLYRVLNQFPDALSYYNNVLLRAEKARDASSVNDALILITEVLIAQHQPQRALSLAQEKLRQYPLKDPFRIDSLNLLARGYLANHQLGPAELCNSQLINALESNRKLISRRGLLLTAFMRAANIALINRQYDKARICLGKAAAQKGETYSSTTERMLLLLFKVDSSQGNYVAAIRHQQRYQQLRDSVFNEKRSKQLAGLQVLYDMKEKEHAMALLTKQNQVQQANLRQREWQRNTSLAGVFMLAVVLGLGYNRYRLKQRSNRLLESQRQEIAAQNQTLEKVLTEKSGLLEEKEWMLKEIHHRVKNNLQIIGSLLRSQSIYMQDGEARAAVRESRNRVHSMALIHQKLYQSNRLAGVPMAAYIQEIVDHLLASFNCQESVQTHLAVAPLEMDVTLAVPLGLILNEAITNALKYAFPAGQAGNLYVGLEAPQAHCYQLTVRDDGVGFAPEFEPTQSRTLGLSLIQGLSKQIGGRLLVEGTSGVHIRLEFDQTELVAHA